MATMNPVVWFEIYVQDMARARAFYETVLQVQLMKMDPPEGDCEMFGFPGGPESAGACGSLVRMAGVPSGGNSTLVYFSCQDCAVEAGRVVAAGGQVHRPKFSIGPYGAIALVSDPEGNMIGLHSMA